MKSIFAKSVPVVLCLSLMASPALARPAQEPSPEGEVAPESVVVDSTVEAKYTKANRVLEGQIVVNDTNESNKMCSAFRRVNLYQLIKTKSGLKSKLAAWDSATADGVFRWRLDEGLWSVKTPRFSYRNSDGTKVECKAAQLAKRIKV